MARMAGMLPWLAAVARTRREGLPPERRKQVHVAAAADVTQPTIARFERAMAWPRHIDEVVDAYAQLLDTRSLELWEQALHLWRLHEAGELSADTLDLDEVEEALEQFTADAEDLADTLAEETQPRPGRGGQGGRRDAAALRIRTAETR